MKVSTKNARTEGEVRYNKKDVLFDSRDLFNKAEDVTSARPRSIPRD